MEVSNNKLYVGAGSDNGSFDLGIIVNPFIPAIDDRICQRAPIICINCGGYLSVYSTIHATTDEWTCALCGNDNKPFHSLPSQLYDPKAKLHHLSEVFVELQTPFAEFHEVSADVSPSRSNIMTDEVDAIHIFAIDSTLCHDPKLGLLLEKGLSGLPTNTRVGVIIYSRSINILRLCTMKNNFPLASDTLSGEVDQSMSILHLLSQGIHLIEAEIALKRIKLIISGLNNFSAVTSAAESRYQSSRGPSRRAGVVCHANVLVGLAVALGKLRGPGVRLVMVSNRLLPIKHTSAVSSDDVPEQFQSAKTSASPNSVFAYTKLGRDAFFRGCWVDIFSVGNDSSYFDKLDALAGASGGHLVVAESLGDDSLSNSFSALLRKSAVARDTTSRTTIERFSRTNTGARPRTFLPLQGTVASMEVRTSSNLSVERIVGPLMGAQDAVTGRARLQEEASKGANGPTVAGAAGQALLTAGMLSVDKDHVAYTLSCIDAAAASRGVSANSALKHVDKLESSYRNLVKLSEDTAVCCALCRCDPSTEVTLHLQHRLPESSGMPGFWGSLQSPTLPAAISNSASVSTESSCAYVQCVLRYVCADTGLKITKIWTQRLAVTREVDHFLEALDERIWSLVHARTIVSDYHGALLAAHGGAYRPKGARVRRPGQRQSSGRNEGDLRQGAIDAIDQRTKKLTEVWIAPSGKPSSKLQAVLRSLYHLREGPLLDGPVMQAQESYLLRSHFLVSATDQAMCILAPRVQLVANPDNDLLVSAAASQVPLVKTKSADSADPSSSLPSATQTWETQGVPPPMPMLQPPHLAPSAMALPPPPPPPVISTTAPRVALPPPPPPLPFVTAQIQAVPSTYSPVPSVAMHPPLPQGGPVEAAEMTSAEAAAIPPRRERAGISFAEVPAESMALLPDTVALMDFGDTIIIRSNSRTVIPLASAPLTVESSSSSMLSPVAVSTDTSNPQDDTSVSKCLVRACEEAALRAQQRYPTPAVVLLRRAGTPQDRLAFARLSPSHTDTTETLMATFPALPLLSAGKLEDMTSYAPPTDQTSFSRYLWETVPKYAAAAHDEASPPRRSPAPPSMHAMERGRDGRREIWSPGDVGDTLRQLPTSQMVFPSTP